MPGLISSEAYLASKEALCKEGRLEEKIEAMEWRLINETKFESYQVVFEDQMREPIHAFLLPSSDGVPGLIVEFVFETFGGERKICMLDVWISEDDDEET